jgi:hypothetical protein
MDGPLLNFASCLQGDAPKASRLSPPIHATPGLSLEGGSIRKDNRKTQPTFSPVSIAAYGCY